MLKPQDLLVVLKLLVLGDAARHQTYSSLARSLGLSGAETHAAVNRAVQCRLLSAVHGASDRRNGLPSVSVNHLLRFVEHGLPYVFPAQKGPVAKGMPTSLGAAPLRDEFIVGTEELLPVWPWSKGDATGQALQPIYRSCQVAALNDAKLYRLLALIDAIRDEGIRQRSVATKLFKDEAFELSSGVRQLAHA